MTYNQDQLNEMLSLPIGLKEIGTVEGIKLYSSIKLKHKFRKALIKGGFKNSKILDKLIDKNYIIPCYLTKGLMGFAFYKIFANDNKKSICGFYSPTSKRIYALISNNLTFGVYTSNKLLAKLTLHEGMHKLFDQSPSVCKSTFGDKVEEFYTNYIKITYGKYLTHNADIKKAGKEFAELTYNFEVKDKFNREVINNHIESINQIINNVITSKGIYKLEDQGRMIYEYTLRTDTFFKNIQTHAHFILDFLKAYKKTFGGKPNLMPVQEFIFYSEVIAASSEVGNNSKYVAGFDKLKLR